MLFLAISYNAIFHTVLVLIKNLVNIVNADIEYYRIFDGIVDIYIRTQLVCEPFCSAQTANKPV